LAARERGGILGARPRHRRRLVPLPQQLAGSAARLLLPADQIGRAERSAAGAGGAAVKAAMLLAAALLAGCDWVQNAFINSLPIKGSGGGEVHVYLGLDGVDWTTLQAARDHGAFAGPEWRAAKFIDMFPGTSDASWTRIL